MNKPHGTLLDCGQVLTLLDDYVDGSIAPEAKELVEEHVAACGLCERFGGAYAAVVKTIRGRREHKLSQEQASRLDAALKARL